MMVERQRRRRPDAPATQSTSAPLLSSRHRCHMTTYADRFKPPCYACLILNKAAVLNDGISPSLDLTDDVQ
jgi:hypothetical protein